MIDHSSSGLQLHQVTLHLRGKPLFLPVSGQVLGGDILTVMGPSGAGKSSLLSAIAGLLPTDITLSGQILLDGQEVTALPAYARKVGLMFQDSLLFPHMSVADNLAFALPREIARHRHRRKEAIEAALEEADLNGFGGRNPATLSGGQKARIALMRVLLSQPACLLLDEPFSRLDAALRQSIRDFVFSHARKRHLPVFLVTHDAEDAAAAGGERIVLSVPDGS